LKIQLKNSLEFLHGLAELKSLSHHREIVSVWTVNQLQASSILASKDCFWSNWSNFIVVHQQLGSPALGRLNIQKTRRMDGVEQLVRTLAPCASQRSAHNNHEGQRRAIRAQVTSPGHSLPSSAFLEIAFDGLLSSFFVLDVAESPITHPYEGRLIKPINLIAEMGGCSKKLE
jgi:hypothetical protein